MDLKLKFRDIFFKDSRIQTNKIAILSFISLLIGVMVFEYAEGVYWYELLNMYSIINGLVMGVFFTVMVYLVCIAVEDDMFATGNADRLVDMTVKLTVGSAVVIIILLLIGEWGFYSIISAAAMALVIFLFGEILAISIENGIRPNKAFTGDTIVMIAFCVIFALTIFYTQFSGGNDYFYVSFMNVLTSLICAVVFTLPVAMIAYSLEGYGNFDPKPRFTRVSFDDLFSMDVPLKNASLPDVKKSIEEFGEVKEWLGDDYSVRYFSFKNEDVGKEIMESMDNPGGLISIDNAKYTVLKKTQDNSYTVFDFKDSHALAVSGGNLELLMRVMESVRYEIVKPADDQGIIPLNEKSTGLALNPVCDVCGSKLDTDTSFFVPDKVFYSSKKYRQWIKNHYSLLDSQVAESISEMEKNDTTEGSAVCKDCIELFD